MPAGHLVALHCVASMTGTFGGAHVRHTPPGENLPSAQSAHIIPLKVSTGPSPGGQDAHAVFPPFTTFGLSQVWHSPPRAEKRPSAHAKQADWSVLGCWPGRHRVHVLCSASTMFGISHSWQTPIVEYVALVQSTHSLPSALGPSPGRHAEHCDREPALSTTTFGGTQSWHSTPNDENVAP